MFLSEVEAFKLVAVVEAEEKVWLQQRLEKGNVRDYSNELEDISQEVDEYNENLQEGNYSNEEVLSLVNRWKKYFKENDIERYNRDLSVIDQIGRNAQSEM